MPDSPLAPALEARVESLEAALRGRTRALVAVAVAAVLLPLGLTGYALFHGEQAHVGASYLLSDEAGVIYSLARVGGEPRTASFSLQTYPSGSAKGGAGEVQLVARQDGEARLTLNAGIDGASRGLELSADAEDAGLTFARRKDGSRLRLTTDDGGLVLRTLDRAGKTLAVARVSLVATPDLTAGEPPTIH